MPPKLISDQAPAMIALRRVVMVGQVAKIG